VEDRGRTSIAPCLAAGISRSQSQGVGPGLSARTRNTPAGDLAPSANGPSVTVGASGPPGDTRTEFAGGNKERSPARIADPALA